MVLSQNSLERKGAQVRSTKSLGVSSPGTPNSRTRVRAPDYFEHNDGTPSKRSRKAKAAAAAAALRSPSVPASTSVSASASLAGTQQSTTTTGGDLATLNTTSYNDPIHQHIVLDDLTTRLIDTPQFQRLHSLRQLGTCDYVYRGATHTRFEHSVGVAYLAEKVINKIRRAQPDLAITDVDVMCVKMAGLCHDLGHGPFSHVFDGVFIKRMHPNGLGGQPGKYWRHEDGSVMMFESMLESNGIDLRQYGIEEIDLVFIKEIIAGTKEGSRRGRTAEKFWMYDIVNNSRSGLDVDKLDYFMRDMRYSNVHAGNNDFTRFIELGRVLPAQPINGSLTGLDPDQLPMMICYPVKMYEEALGLFQVRYRMHRTVYTHKTVKQIEFMITDALQLADEYIRISGTPNEAFPDGQYKLSECVFDMAAFAKLKDTVLDHIMLQRVEVGNPHYANLAKAQEIISRVQQRDLYRCVGKITHTRDARVAKMKEQKILNEILEESQIAATEVNGSSSSSSSNGGGHERARDEAGGELVGEADADDAGWDVNLPSGVLSPCEFSNLSQGSVGGPAPYMHAHPGSFGSQVELTKEDLIVEKMHIHHGMKANNPVSRLRFFPKHSGEGAIGLKIDEKHYETALPKVFEDFAVRVFCRNPDKEDTARDAFKRWATKYV